MKARTMGRTVKIDEERVRGGAAALGNSNGRMRTVGLDGAANGEKEAEAGSDGSQFQPGLRGRKLLSGAAAIISDAPAGRLPIAPLTKAGFTRSRVGNPAPAPPSLAGATVRFVVRHRPVGKPTMTRRDQWLVGDLARPCVQAYRDWCDAIRAAADRVAWPPVLQGRLLVVSYLPILPSYAKGLRLELPGQPCHVKPDEDNILKGIKDALFEEDSFIYDSRSVKYWDDGQGVRAEVSLA